MRLLTYNCGLLKLGFGPLHAQPAPFVDQRFAALAPALDCLAADVVVLQEIYSSAQRHALAAALIHRYPYVAGLGGRSAKLIGHGLLVLSATPLLNCAFTAFRRVLLSERLVAEKGFLRLEVQSPSTSPEGPALFDLFNVYTSSGGLGHPESAHATAVRAAQVEQVCAAALGAERPVVVAGDLNAGPEASASVYRKFAAAGYCDTFDLVSADRKPEVAMTWEPNNSLNSRGPHRSSPPQRIDHIFVVAAAAVQVTDWRLALNQPIVPVAGGQVTLSDHYGVLADLRFHRPSRAS